jgi:thiol:disulfide interchange protein DsbD
MKVIKRIYLAVFIILGTLQVNAQMLTPVEWSTNVDGKYLEAIATLEPGWHLYSQYNDDFPFPTKFTFDTASFSVNNNPVISFFDPDYFQEPSPITEFVKEFDMELSFFKNKVVFRQEIDKRNTQEVILEAEVEFIVCNDEMCLPPDYLKLTWIIPATDEIASNIGSTASDDQTNINADDLISTSEIPEKKEIIRDTVISDSLFGIFGEGMFWGFFAIIMPCIFPMIPLTVSFFMKQSKSRSEGISKAITYGVSINVIYVALGLFVTIIFGGDALNALATNPWFNLAFFFLFVVFAISFFGAFEITLPAKWVDGSDTLSNKGGLFGIFFMAFTLALVSFSCTGPLIGTLLVRASQSGELLAPAIGMFGFSFALSLPFMLFAAFPSWLQSLPKSGGWLNSAKVVLGFLELAFALKFLSTADMVWQYHMLNRELFIAIWTGISFITAYYLFGGFRLPNDSKSDYLGVGRMLLGSGFLIIAFYLLPGIFGAPVKLISGFPPPLHYSEKYGSGASASAHSDKDKMIFNNDLQGAIAYAKEVNKPVMIDFTGWGCVNCRKMEEQVWTDLRVKNILSKEVVLVSLYVDERIVLPKDEQYVSEVSGKEIKRVGQKWSDFQATNYNANAQPYYVLIDPNGSFEPLNGSAAYHPDASVFVDWLQDGIDRFKLL